MSLNPPTEHQLLIFWVGLLLILVVARVLGGLMQRIGQPAVVGELAAGLLLGPSLLGRVAPDVFDWLFPADDVQTGMLFTVGWLGVLLLLVATGFETDLGLIGRLGRAATYVSAGSLVVPAAAGLLVGWLVPTAFVGPDTERYIFALFFAAALSISSLPVIAKILSEMGFMRRDFGQLTLAAGMANDVVGWVGLGLIAGLAQAGGVKLDKLAITVFGLIAFFAAAFTIGQRAVDGALRRVRMRGDDPLEGLSVVLITSLAFGAVTQALHVEAVLGAFVGGVILARSRFSDHDLIRPLETMTAAFFAPIFFATAGLRVDLGLLADGETLLWAFVVLFAASVSKFVGSLLGARLSLLPVREGAALGVGLNARGALEIVIATVGLSLGVLNDRSYTVIVLMAMATSMLAPPMLRRVLSGWDGSPEERARLDLENQLATNTIVRGGRVLIPTQGGVSSLLAAQITHLTWPDAAPVTLLTVGDEGLEVDAHRDVLFDREVEVDRREGSDVAEAIAAEAALGYDAIVIGQRATDGGDLSPLVQRLLRQSPIPVVVVRNARRADGRLPWAFQRAVVPTNGARSSRGAQEIANYVSSQIGTHIHYLHVPTAASSRLESVLGDHGAHTAEARQIVRQAQERAAAAGANSSTMVEHAARPGEQVVNTARELGADLVIVSGVTRRIGEDVLLGQTISQVLTNTETTLIVAVTPGEPATDSEAEPEPETESESHLDQLT